MSAQWTSCTAISGDPGGLRMIRLLVDHHGRFRQIIGIVGVAGLDGHDVTGRVHGVGQWFDHAFQMIARLLFTDTVNEDQTDSLGPGLSSDALFFEAFCLCFLKARLIVLVHDRTPQP